MLKKILSVLAVCLFIAWQQVNAVTVVYTIPAGVVWNSTNLLGSAKAATVNSIVISTGTSGGATNLGYAFTDFPGSNSVNGWSYLYKTNTGYMQISQYLTNLTKIVTNFGSGDGAGNYVTFTNTFTNALYTYTNYVGATSNGWRVVAAGTVGSNSSATITGNFPFIYGIGFTNNNIGKDITLTVDYDLSL